MWCGKSNNCGKLAPVCFGLAFGLTVFFAMFICDLWMMQYGVPPEKAKYIVEPLTLGGSFIHALLGLFQGFVFGLFIAIFYDLLCCCCKHTSASSCCSCKKPMDGTIDHTTCAK